jgi:sporulation-control protein
MSFFNRMLASLGIGSAKVDTVLEKARFLPGEEVKGIVKIQGGSVDQDVDSIYIHLMTQYIKESDDKKYTVNAPIRKFKVSDPIKVQANEIKEIPFSFVLPLETPTTVGRTPVWLKTGLDIEMAVDSSDHDNIQVQPHPYVQTVLDAVGDLGFRMKSVLTEYSPRFGQSLPYVQEFEFYPGGRFSGRMKELELVFFISEQGLDVIVEADRRAGGLMGMLESALDMDERKQRMFISRDELRSGTQALAGTLENAIQRHIR